MPAPPASVSPPAECVKQKAYTECPTSHRGQAVGGGLCPKAGACQPSLHGAGLMFAAGRQPSREWLQREGGF